jgi:uncharacterized phage protein gp47/JayE
LSEVSGTWGGINFFTQLQVAAIQAQAAPPVDASQGSLTLAWTEGNDGIALWLQAQNIAVMLLTRASTSTGAPLDSWMADWYFYRLPATVAVGQATFSRYTASGQAMVYPGTLLTTSPNGPQFVVTTDTTNAAWSPSAGAYVIANSVASVTVPIAAVVAGAAGNAGANTIIFFSAPVAGFDTVTNAAALTGGANAESDAAFRARFWLYIASLREATPAALIYYITSLQQGVTAQIVENYTYLGAPDPGFIYAVVDDGSGDPPSSLLTAAGLQIDAHRAAGIGFAVYGPTVTYANVAATLTTVATAVHASVVTTATAALTNFINALPDGTNLPYTRIAQVLYDSSTAITNVSGVTLNGATADLTVSAQGVIKACTIALT